MVPEKYNDSIGRFGLVLFCGVVILFLIVGGWNIYQEHYNSKPDYYSEDQIQLRQKQQEQDARGTLEQCLAWNQSWSSQPQMQRNCADIGAP